MDNPNEQQNNPTPGADPSATTPNPAQGEGVQPTEPKTDVVETPEAPKAGEPSTENPEESADFLHPVDEQGDGGKNDEGEKGEGKEESESKTLGAPEGDYEFKAPEDTQLDPIVTDKLSAVAKELNLSQEAVQKIVDRVAPAFKDQGEAQIKSLRKSWGDESRADAEFGGQDFKANMAAANRAYTHFAPQKLQEIFKASGLDHNPEVIRMFHRLAKATSEGSFVQGSNAGGVPKGDLRETYKGMNP